MAKYKVKTKDCQLIVKAKLEHGEKMNDEELDFFSRKYIRGLLKAKLIRKNNVEYTGPIGISLYERLRRPINKYDFFFLIEQVVDLTQKLEVNGLTINKVILDIKAVYVNEITKEIQFIYLPLEQPPVDVNIFRFLESIIYATTPMQEADTEYISRFVYFLSGLSQFDVVKMENYISREEPNVVNTIKRHTMGQSGFMTDKQVDYYSHYSDNGDEATGLLEEEATGLLNEEEATGLLNEEEATGLLVEEEEEEVVEAHYPTLHRINTDETIMINKPVFRIGKERTYSDYLVTNNDKVSRNHADIIVRGQQYYVTDLNSKNKTYINGQVIPVQQETEITNGDHLKLANEEFIFYT